MDAHADRGKTEQMTHILSESTPSECEVFDDFADIRAVKIYRLFVALRLEWPTYLFVKSGGRPFLLETSRLALSVFHSAAQLGNWTLPYCLCASKER
jgi:hypothetical protein